MDSAGELLCFFSFCPNENKNFCVGVPENSFWKLLLSSEEKRFGGEGAALPAKLAAITADEESSAPCGGEAAVKLDLPPLCAAIYKRIYR